MAKILVVDDDGIVRDALAVFLTRDGHEVVTAADGTNGLLVFKNTKPDLVVLDRNMPGLSGSKVFDGIRGISKTVPVLILSGYDEPEEVEAYMRCGAAGFLSKADGLSPVLAEIDRLLGITRKAPAAAVKPAPAPPGHAAGNLGLVLVADDDAETRAVLRRLVGRIDCEALEAKDGQEALALARDRRPDIILLDISMPFKDGVQVLRELAPEMPGVGFMMITGNDDEQVARECLTLGAFDYVSKPVNMENLTRILKARLVLQSK